MSTVVVNTRPVVDVVVKLQNARFPRLAMRKPRIYLPRILNHPDLADILPDVRRMLAQAVKDGSLQEHRINGMAAYSAPEK